ncbi:DUF4118 domain-containing protein, partial [Bordetella pertussis]|uniref:DUF4118 domain-containing protein n=1 Tax=Bordetella pertussis TaxID=520 RepID=UPI001071297F
RDPRSWRNASAPAGHAAAGAYLWALAYPLASFAVSDVQYLLTFAVLLTVGLLIGQLTAGLRQQARAAARREADARGLYEFARELSAALQPEQIAGAASAFLNAAFGARGALYIL